jgi:DNA helicase-2/ATP-dependent DNA helicase PcrA
VTDRELIELALIGPALIDAELVEAGLIEAELADIELLSSNGFGARGAAGTMHAERRHSDPIDASTIADALALPGPTRQQRAVIEAPLSPALVIAGAGSGKTETMANRVLWLLANGHVHARDILGLTFTRKAAG